MNTFIDIAKMYNIITAKLQHTPRALSMREFCEMVELSNEKPVRIRDCLKQLHKQGKIRKVPYSSAVDKRERVGYEWVTAHAHAMQYGSPCPPAVKPADDLRIKVNDDHSITITTKAIRITIEVPQ